MISFFEDSVSDAQKHAMECYPNESCGLILKSGYMACENKSDTPAISFHIDGSITRKHFNDIKCIIHSHVDGIHYPSMIDMKHQLKTGKMWGIINAQAQYASPILFFGRDLKDKKLDARNKDLVGREFIHGVQDCYSLVRDWFWFEKNIDLLEFPRQWGWWNSGSDLYVENFKLAGFVDVPFEAVRPGDCFLMKFKSDVVNHGGVYLGDGDILHHCSGERGFDSSMLSHKRKLGALRKFVYKWVRYAK